jgi:hypothetical protein
MGEKGNVLDAGSAASGLVSGGDATGVAQQVSGSNAGSASATVGGGAAPAAGGDSALAGAAGAGAAGAVGVVGAAAVKRRGDEEKDKPDKSQPAG